MSLSIAENLEWEHQFALDNDKPFPWHDWITCVGNTYILPVYDLSSIVDVSAAYDMVRHARYCGSYDLFQACRVPNALMPFLQAVQLYSATQMQYFVHALYCHCQKYTTAMKYAAPPSTIHMEMVPIVPYDLLRQLDAILQQPVGFVNWLENSILHNSKRPFTTVCKLKIHHGLSGRRQRKLTSSDDTSHAQELMNQKLSLACSKMHDLSPLFMPVFVCTVSTHSAKNVKVTIEVH